VEATAGMPLAQALAAVDQSVFVTEFPIPVSEPMLHRGSDRFQIFCTPCHGSSGYGGGPVVQRGFPPPPSFHQPRLRDVPVGYLFHVISQGHGKMPGFEAVVSVEDRWAIAAFVRVLQFSQHARLEQLPAAVREPFQNLPRPDPPRAAGESDEPPVAKESS
jgi:mono/diheme cytochrome c family protein